MKPCTFPKRWAKVEKALSNPCKAARLEQCVEIGLRATDFYAKRQVHRQQTGRLRRGIGMSVMIHGSGIAGLDMAAATLKMNDDGSFNLLIGATDLGTGSDTILAQIAAEVLDIPLEDMIVYSSDTDFTPFDKGAYASSTTYISGGAVRKAALQIKEQILEHAARMLSISEQGSLKLEDRKVIAPDGRSVTLAEVALSSLHQIDQHQIMATASHTSQVSPPPTAAQFAEVVLDTESGADHGRALVDGGGLRPGDQPNHRRRAGGRRHGASPGVCAHRRDALRQGRSPTQSGFCHLPHSPRPGNAADGCDLCPDR